jgi:hypothetical protein
MKDILDFWDAKEREKRGKYKTSYSSYGSRNGKYADSRKGGTINGNYPFGSGVKKVP